MDSKEQLLANVTKSVEHIEALCKLARIHLKKGNITRLRQCLQSISLESSFHDIRYAALQDNEK